MHTPSQMWAKDRNFGKFKLDGIIQNLKIMANDSTLNEDERKDVAYAGKILNGLSKKWSNGNAASKAAYLRTEKTLARGKR